MRALVFFLICIASTAQAFVAGNGDPSQYYENVYPPATCDVVITAGGGSDTGGRYTGNELAAIFNNASHSVFCVDPGVRHGTVITITESGWPGKRKWVLLNDGGTAHPASLPREDQADIRMILDGASYWTFHRITIWHQDDGGFGDTVSITDSTNTTFNEIYLFNPYRGMRIQDNSHHTRIQRSWIGGMQWDALRDDRVCVNLISDVYGAPIEVVGTRLVDNEFTDCGDAFQPVRLPFGQEANYPDTIVDGNTFWYSSDVSTDCDGNQDDDGPCACAENHIDIKVGSEDPDKPMRITNNIMWGQKEKDRDCGSSGGATPPSTTVHEGTFNLIFDDNFIHGGSSGWTCAAPDELISIYACEGLSFQNNTVMNIGTDYLFVPPYPDPSYTNGHAITMLDVNKAKVRNNQVLGDTSNPTKNYFYASSVSDKYTVNSDFTCNIVTNTDQLHQYDANPTLIFSFNLYEGNGDWLHSGSGDVINPGGATYTDFTAKYNVYKGLNDSITFTDAIYTNTAALPIQCRIAPKLPTGVTAANASGDILVQWTAPTAREDDTALPLAQVDDFVIELAGNYGDRRRIVVSDNTDISATITGITDYSYQARVTAMDSASQLSQPSAWVDSNYNGAATAPTNFTATDSGSSVVFAWDEQSDNLRIEQWNHPSSRWDTVKNIVYGATATLQHDRLGPIDGSGERRFRAASDRFGVVSAFTPEQVTP